MKSTALLVLLILTSAAATVAQDLASSAVPQSSSSRKDDEFRGFNAYTSISGLLLGSGSLIKLDSSVGYDFNRNFGLFAGAPLYFTNDFGGSTRTAGMGDAYFGAEVYAFPKLFQYSSTVTVAFPTGSTAKALSSGVVTADWTNHFRKPIGKLTPSFSVGVANTVGVAIGALPSSQLVDGSLSAKGNFVHMEEGADFDITKKIYVGAEGYHILPFGRHSSGGTLTGSKSDSIVAENGMDAWVGFLPNKLVSTEIGYSRSITFASDSLSFRMTFNIGRMLRGTRQHL